MIEGRKEIVCKMMHSAHFIYNYMAKNHSADKRENMLPPLNGLTFQLEARDLLYAPSLKHNSTHRHLYYTSYGALAGTSSN